MTTTLDVNDYEAVSFWYLYHRHDSVQTPIKESARKAVCQRCLAVLILSGGVVAETNVHRHLCVECQKPVPEQPGAYCMRQSDHFVGTCAKCAGRK